jgi:hypothetical protein
MNKKHPFSVIKHGLQYYPSIFPSVYAVLAHVFTTNGNGYDLDKDGNLAYDAHDEKPICITDEGLYWLKHDMISRASYYIYPISSYQSELKDWGGDSRFYTDIYHYPKMNEEWQRAARWFLNQIVSRDPKWWKQHFKAKAADPKNDGFGGSWGEKLNRILTVRKHLLAFAKKFKIEISSVEALEWERDLLNFLAPQRN